MTFSSTWLAVSAICALATFFIHLILGGRDSAAALLASDMSFVPKYTNYYCWHGISITLLALAVGLAVPLIMPSAWELAMAGILLSAAFGLWSIALWRISGAKSILSLPQWTLFALISGTGVIAFLTGGA